MPLHIYKDKAVLPLYEDTFSDGPDNVSRWQHICIAFQWIGPVSDQPVRNLELIIFFSGKNEKCSECLEMQNKHLMYYLPPPHHPAPHQDPMCLV